MFLFFRNVSVVLDDVSEEDIEDVIGVFSKLVHSVTEFNILESVNLRDRYLLTGIYLHSVYGGPAPGTNVSASTHVRVIENILNMFIYLIAVGGFEANISVHVLEGWLSDYVSSTTPGLLQYLR